MSQEKIIEYEDNKNYKDNLNGNGDLIVLD